MNLTLLLNFPVLCDSDSKYSKSYFLKCDQNQRDDAKEQELIMFEFTDF